MCLFKDVCQFLFIVQEVLLNVLPGLKGLRFALLLLHKILPDILEVLGLHDAEPAASLLQLPQGCLDLRFFPHKEAPHQDEQAHVLGLAKGSDDAVSTNCTGTRGNVPGDIVLQGWVTGWQDSVEEGFLSVSCGMLILKVAPGCLYLASLVLHFYHITKEGLVSSRTVLHIPELKLEVVDWQPFPMGQGDKGTEKRMSSSFWD